MWFSLAGRGRGAIAPALHTPVEHHEDTHSLATLSLDARLRVADEPQLSSRRPSGGTGAVCVCFRGVSRYMLDHIRRCEPQGRIPWEELHGPHALASAIHHDYPECVKMLLVYGVLKDYPDHGVHMLHRAICNRNPRIAMLLMKIGNANPNTQLAANQNRNDDSPDGKQQKDKVKDMMLRNQKGSTALMEAAWFGLHEVVEFCIKKGADLEADNLRGDTALLLAAQGCVSTRRAPSLAPRAALFSSRSSRRRLGPRLVASSGAKPFHARSP